MTVTDDQIKQALDAFADFQHQREYLKLQKQELINKAIPPEVQAELESIDAEFEGKDKVLDEKEKQARRVLDMMLEQYADSLSLGDEKVKLNSQLATVTFSKGDVVWDARSLDAFVIAGHPEILSFRKEEKPKFRVVRKKL